MDKAERSWIMYDVGNSALVMLATSIIPIYFNWLAGGHTLVAWSYAETVATLIVALLMPVLGSIADMQGMKKKFIVGTVGTGAVVTVALGIPVAPMAFLVLYVISSVMLNASCVFYDALLVDATTDERMDEVSSSGYAWGYIGSCVPFIVCLLVVFKADALGLSLRAAMQIAFAVTALWWVAFTVPLLRNVEQTHFKKRLVHPVREAFRGLGVTIRRIWNDRVIRYFLLAYFFYIDGVHTIIKLATSYGTNLGIDSMQLVLALLVTQFVAFPSAIVYGKLGRRVGTRPMIIVGILGYTFITCFAALHLTTAVDFWFLAIMVGLFQGGIQALSRSEFGKLCPKEHANEYFGFFDIFGKYAAVLGTFIVGTMTVITGSGQVGIISIVILFVVGLVLMLKMPMSDEVR
jgi:UMF1 family MFS transporter